MIGRTAWIGADPGMSGALALFDTMDQGKIEVQDMPYRDVSGKKSMDFWGLAGILNQWAARYQVQGAAIERVHSMPKQGVVSSFSFGGAFYALQQAFASAGIPFTLIQPATWKAVYGLRGGRENKAMSRAKASLVFPVYAGLWARAKDDGRAEAVLLAHYGSKLRSVA